MTIDIDKAEAFRLSRLDTLQVLDTPSEPLFDALAEAAALMTGTPIALITLLDANRQWFKANIGLTQVTQTSRSISFCDHTIRDDQLMEVPDACSDPRFSENPLVVGEPHVRFYAGAPIVLREGIRIGSLCVIDHHCRTLTDIQRKALSALARATAEALEQRAVALERSEILERDASRDRQRANELASALTALASSEAFLDRTGRVAGVGGWEFSIASGELTWSAQTCRIHDLPPGHKASVEEAVNYYDDEARILLDASMQHCKETGIGWDLELPLHTATGRSLWVRAYGEAIQEDGKVVGFTGAIQDVTARRHAVAALEASESRFRSLFQYSLGFICTHDLDGILLSVNPAAARSLGYVAAELLGMPFTHFMRPERASTFKAYLGRIAAVGTDSGFLELVAKDGTVQLWQYHNVLDRDGDEPYVLGHAQDVTEHRRTERMLRDRSHRDHLTGCGNRRLLAKLAAGASDDALWACIAIDLDRFKAVNDTFGHQRGDEVLVEMTQFLNRHCGMGDTVIRMGGDEFLIIMEGSDKPAILRSVTHMVRDREQAPIGFTIGTAVRSSGEPLEQMVARADQALYEAKARR